jgi:hypothetical protein
VRGAYAARAAVAVLALLGGAVVGMCVVVLHPYWWGFLLGAGATAALLVTLPGGWWRRLPFAAGWFAVAAVLAVERPEGDYLVRSSAEGYLLLGASVVVLLGGIVGLRDHRPPDAANSGPDGSTS